MVSKILKDMSLEYEKRLSETWESSNIHDSYTFIQDYENDNQRGLLLLYSLSQFPSTTAEWE